MSTKVYLKQQNMRLYRSAVIEAFLKLNPRHMLRNPVMFVVEVGSALTSFLAVQALAGRGEAPAGFITAISLWLWFTVLFANFSEALAEGRGKAQAESLRRTRKETSTKRLSRKPAGADKPEQYETIPSTSLSQGDYFLSTRGGGHGVYYRIVLAPGAHHRPGRRRQAPEDAQ